MPDSMKKNPKPVTAFEVPSDERVLQVPVQPDRH
jgi:hypothetical protein